MSVRLVQCATGKGSGLNGWKGVEEVLKALPGATFDEIQEEDAERRIDEGESFFCLVVLRKMASDVGVL